MKVIITGNSGFIGSNLTENLFKNDNFVVGIDKDYSSKHRLESFLPKNVKMYMLSSNFVAKNFTMIWENINNIMRYHYCFDDADIVYHLAAASDIKKSAEDTEWDVNNNINGTHEVLEMMRKKDIPKIVFTSTSALYGENPVFPTSENEPLIASSLYSASKISAEHLIQAYCESYGMKGWIFRFGNVVGKNQHRGVVVDFINKLKENKETLEILGNGKQIKSYVYVSDCINAMLSIPKLDNNKKHETYNIATYDQINVDKVAEIVCENLGVRPLITYTGGKRGWKGDIPTIKLSIQKALNTGWTPKYKCKDAIKKAVEELK